MSKQRDDTGLSRLGFLKTSGAMVVAFSLPVVTNKAGIAEAAPSSSSSGANAFAAVNAGALDSWLAIGPDGGVTVYTGRVELGTGAVTGLAQIVAEELDVPFERLTMVTGDTALTPDQGPTCGVA